MERKTGCARPPVVPIDRNDTGELNRMVLEAEGNTNEAKKIP